MHCEHCGKKFKTDKALKLNRDGQKIGVGFCSYSCYKAFWAGNNQFEPLPEWEGTNEKGDRIPSNISGIEQRNVGIGGARDGRGTVERESGEPCIATQTV